MSAPAGRLLELRLPADGVAAERARRGIRSLDAQGREDALDDLVTVTNELVTNAVLHSTGEVQVRVAAVRSGWRVEVTDDGRAPLLRPPPAPRAAGDDMATAGRGLALVEALSDDWGSRRGGTGTTVWAEVGTGRAATRTTSWDAAEVLARRDAVAAWAASLQGRDTRAVGALVPARLLSMPLRLLEASKVQLDDVVRELSVVDALDPRAHALAERLSEPFARSARVVLALRLAAEQAQRDGRRLVDVDVPLTPEVTTGLRELLVAVEELTGSDGPFPLLALPPTSEVRAFRRWIAEELERQLAGAPARPCPHVGAVRPAEPLTDATAEVPLLRRVQRIGAALAGVDSTEAVHEIVLRDLARVTGSNLTSLWLLQPDHSLVMRTAPESLDASLRELWSRLPASADLPVTEVARTGIPLFWNDEAGMLADFPALQGQPRKQTQATAVLPLRVADGRILGALAMSFPERRQWIEHDRDLLRLLADAVAQALDRTRLQDQQRASARALDLLARAGAALGSSLEAERIAAGLLELVVPELGDVAVVHLRRDRALEVVGVAATDPDAGEAVRALDRRFPSALDLSSTVGRVVLQARVEQWQHAPEEMLRASAVDDEHFALLQRLNLGAGLAVPLVARDHAIGAVTVLRVPGRPLLTADVDLALALAGRAAVALANAELFAAEQSRTKALQETLLPPGLPAVEGLELGVTYSAAGGGEQVGGDFYDAVEVGGSLVLAIGDVRGRGVEAAALTGLARHTIRALAWQGLPPAAVLRELDRALQLEGRGRDEPAFCTAALGVVARCPGGARLRLASGGHPAPFLRRAGGRVERLVCPGDLLGLLEDPHLEEVEVTLGPGDALVVVTDGVLERRGPDDLFDDAGVVRVLEAVDDLPAQGIAETLEAAVRGYAPEPAGDDMAILVLRVPPASGSDAAGRP